MPLIDGIEVTYPQPPDTGHVLPDLEKHPYIPAGATTHCPVCGGKFVLMRRWLTGYMHWVPCIDIACY